MVLHCDLLVLWNTTCIFLCLLIICLLFAVDEKKISIHEIANQRGVLKKTDGWKIRHITYQFDDLVSTKKITYWYLSVTGVIFEFLRNPHIVYFVAGFTPGHWVKWLGHFTNMATKVKSISTWKVNKLLSKETEIDWSGSRFGGRNNKTAFVHIQLQFKIMTLTGLNSSIQRSHLF